MLKVWRGKGRFFVECTNCGCYGTPAAVATKLNIETENSTALERHTAHMMALRTSYTQAAGKIAQQIRDGSLSRKEGSLKIKSLYENHVALVRLGEASLPDPKGKVRTLATNCPWCNYPENVEIEELSDDLNEPEFSLAPKSKKSKSKQGA